MNRRTFLALVSAAPLALKAEPVVSVKIPEPIDVRWFGAIPELNMARLLRCIAEVETGNNDAKVGHRGERSRYQIREMVWRDRMKQSGAYPFARFCDGATAHYVALSHIEWLRKHLQSDVPYWLYFAWQAGLNRTKLKMRVESGRATSSDSSVANLLWMFHAPAKRLDNLYYDKSYAPTNL